MKYFDLFLRSLFQLEHLESCLFSFHFLFHFSGLRSLPLPFLSLRFLPYQCLILRLFLRRLFLCHFFFFFFFLFFFSFFFASFIFTAISFLSSATVTLSGGSIFASIVPDSFIFDMSISSVVIWSISSNLSLDAKTSTSSLSGVRESSSYSSGSSPFVAIFTATVLLRLSTSADTRTVSGSTCTLSSFPWLS